MRAPPWGPNVRRHRLLRILDIYLNKLGDLQYILADRELTDVYINPSGRVRVSDVMGNDMVCILRYTGEELERLASRIRALSGKPFDNSHPMLSYFWGEENCRISAVGYAGSYSGKPDIAVRLWPRKPWHILDIIKMGGVNPRIAVFLTVAANLGAGVIIGGDMGGGKSTLLQSFLFMIPRKVRKVALLTEREIHSRFFEQDFNITEFKVHAGSGVTAEGVPISEAVKQVLVHGESGYLLLNEVKYVEEAGPFFTMAAAAGMSSLLTTMHAEDAKGVVQRLLLNFRLPLSALRNIDWVVTMSLVKFGMNEGRRRVITEIVEVKDFKADPVAEDRLLRIAMYDAFTDDWWTLSVDELLTSSEFLRRSAMKRGMDRGEVEALIKALEMVYQRLGRYHPIPPEKFTVLMENFFDAYILRGSAKEIYKDWWRKCSGLL